MSGKKVKLALGRTERWVAIVSVLALGLVFALFHIITIGGAVVAQGHVAVHGNPRPVQNLEGGVVSEISVKNGDQVETGEILVRLDPTIMRITRDITRGRMVELLARRARLEAEEQQRGIITPPTAPERLGVVDVEKYLTGQREIFQSRRAVLDSQKAQLQERILQYRSQISGLRSQQEATENQITFVAREVNNLQVLNDQDLVPESRLLELQGRQAALLGQIAQYQSELSQVSNAIRDSELKIAQVDRVFREEVVTELREVTAQFDENLLELVRVEEMLKHLDVRAPVAGIVHEMQVWTVGGVVPPQQTLLTIIPVSEGFKFEVQVSPTTIDTVHVGQTARVRFPSFNQRSTPELTGAISGISPDSVTDPKTGSTFYRVDIGLSANELDRLGTAELIPGMPVEVFLLTANRSVLNFLVKPFTDQFVYAFREG